MAVWSRGEIVAFKQAYQLLRVGRSASPAKIKQQYIAKIKEWHPDRCAGDARKAGMSTRMTQDINAAYRLIREAPLQFYTEEPARAETAAAAQDHTAYTADNRSGARHRRTRAYDENEEGRRHPHRNDHRYRYRGRHKTVKAATAYRQRVGAQVRFIFGALSSVFPILYIAVRGRMIYMLFTPAGVAVSLVIALLFGLYAARRNPLNDRIPNSGDFRSGWF